MLKESFIYRTEAWILVLILGLLMIFSFYLGIKLGGLIFKKSEEEHKGDSSIVGALFALYGLLLAFTFSMAGNRYDRRREILVEEANCIGTAILRADMYAEEERKGFREDFKKYLEARIAFFEAEMDTAKILDAMKTGEIYSLRLWRRASQLSKNPFNLAASNQMIPALNAMIDITTTRNAAGLAKVPESIIYLLFMLSIATAFFGGYSRFGKEKIDWFIAIGFCILTVLVIYIILDLDRPRSGLIHLNSTNKNIVELRKLLK